MVIPDQRRIAMLLLFGIYVAGALRDDADNVDHVGSRIAKLQASATSNQSIVPLVKTSLQTPTFTACEEEKKQIREGMRSHTAPQVFQDVRTSMQVQYNHQKVECQQKGKCNMNADARIGQRKLDQFVESCKQLGGKTVSLNVKYKSVDFTTPEGAHITEASMKPYKIVCIGSACSDDEIREDFPCKPLRMQRIKCAVPADLSAPPVPCKEPPEFACESDVVEVITEGKEKHKDQASDGKSDDKSSTGGSARVVLGALVVACFHAIANHVNSADCH